MDAAARGARDIRRIVITASLGFSALLTAFSWILLRIRGRSLAAAFDTSHLLPSAAIGLAIGVAAGGVCLLVVLRLRVMARLRRLAGDALAEIEPRWYHLVAVACSAGWGEELFFRGALQPLAGIWLSSVAFVFLHGAIRFRTRDGVALALFLFTASAGLGVLAREQGLAAAMAAHAGYDLAVLVGMRAAATKY